MSSLRIIVSGLIAQHPTLGGVAWDYLAYVVGLHRMGHDVYYLEDSGQWPYRLDGGPTGTDWVAGTCEANVSHLDAVLGRFGLGDRWAYRFPRDGSWHGLGDGMRGEVVATADLVLNVSGALEHPEQYAGTGRLVYLDGDPVLTQIRYEAGAAGLDLVEQERTSLEALKGRIDDHDAHFSFGERLAASAVVPASAISWRPTRQPILLDEWSTDRPLGASFTTVMSWTSYRPAVFRGETYGHKDLELARFIDLPRLVPSARLELAMNRILHADWAVSDDGRPSSPLAALRERGWRLADPAVVCGDLDRYRAYVQSSLAEWSVAKQAYVAGQPGWLSGRSACYLASGRPAVVQDTGVGDLFPVGDGLLTFTTPDEAASAIDAVLTDPIHHAGAAAQLAVDHFGATMVLDRLLDDVFASAAR